MAFRKSIEPNQKPKSKGLSLPKCFQLSGITKTLFPCKAAPHHNHENYVIMDYGNKTNSTVTSNGPATSTMIESRDNYTQESLHRFYFSGLNRKNDYYHLQPENEYNQMYHNGGYVDIEETPRNNMSISSITSYFTDTEDITIVNNNASPTSHQKNHQSDESYTECLHSTKIDHDNVLTSSVIPNCLSPLSNNKHSTMLHSPIQVANLGSNSKISNTSNYMEISTQLESLIMNLSSIYDERNDTHVCAQNYEATFVDDVTVNFADTLKVLRDNNDDWVYVQISSDGRKGFIPKNIVSDLKDFIEQLKEHHHQLSRSTIINTDL
ncbi:unnamed protein product [Brachionus calyciflorus]|uniref:SH3 domain-containing protein n=1 Tax=Brachionus calyciflorus TaxID=104777 RepID=A0A814AM93_9BILA|nr:unnamed protein product [Brachionus calyciflorus]